MNFQINFDWNWGHKQETELHMKLKCSIFFIEIKMNKNTDKHMDCLLSEHEETFYFNQSL